MSVLKDRLCVIYKGRRRDELYLYVEKDRGMEEVPEELLASMGELSEVMTLLISTNTKLARVDAEQVLRLITQQGYFVQMPPALYPEAGSS